MGDYYMMKEIQPGGVFQHDDEDVIMDTVHIETAVDVNYFSLYEVLVAALDQAQSGKGKERHAVGGQPFHEQQICEITKRVGYGYPAGQAIKKIIESQRLPLNMCKDEILGAINYLAAYYIVKGEMEIDNGNQKQCDCVQDKLSSECRVEEGTQPVGEGEIVFTTGRGVPVANRVK